MLNIVFIFIIANITRHSLYVKAHFASDNRKSQSEISFTAHSVKYFSLLTNPAG